MIADFVAWDDVNFAIDEQWAWFHPYGIEAKRGETVTLTMRLSNHSTEVRTYSLSVKSRISEVPTTGSCRLAARSDGEIVFQLVIPADAAPGVQVVTADVARSDGLSLPRWAEALIKVVE
jgi:hypothetical protein